MNLAILETTFSTLFMSDISESLFEILAVAAFYIGSWFLERRKKKNRPERTPEEALEEAGIIFEPPVEMELPPSTEKRLPSAPAPTPVPPVLKAPSPPPKPVVSADWKFVKSEFRKLNARALTIAQDYGRLPSMRTLVRDYERGIRGATRIHLERLAEGREQWGDARVRRDAEAVLRSLHEVSDFMTKIGQKRAKGDVEWRRWDELATSLYRPLQMVLQQRGEEGGFKAILAVSGAIPLDAMRDLLPKWGFVRCKTPSPLHIMDLVQGIARDLVSSNRTLMLDIYQHLEGDPTQRVFQEDGSIRLSGTHHLISAWIPTLLTDFVGAILGGPGYLQNLEQGVNPRSQTWMESEIPRRGRSVNAPGIIRKRWVTLVLEKRIPGSGDTDETYFDNGIEFYGMEGELPVEVLETALDSALNVLLESPLKVLGGSALGGVTNLSITSSEWNTARKWINNTPPAHLERHNWRAWVAGALTLQGLDEVVHWWRAILPSGTNIGGQRRESQHIGDTSISWQQGFIDRAVFTSPPGLARRRRRVSL